MTSWITLIIGFLKLIIWWFGRKAEKDKMKKQLKKDASDMLKDGLKTRDCSKITAAYDNMKRARR